MPEVIGLIPAAGKANRISPLPCSKELYPIGYRSLENGLGLRPKVVCHYLLERMQVAHIRKAYIVLRQGKWDIPGYFGDGRMLDMHLGYLLMGAPYGVPFTLDQAYPFLGSQLVALGFPDVLWSPQDAFVQLLGCQEKTGADLVLGLFPASEPAKMDMVELDRNGRVVGIQIKPSATDLTHAWMIAVWTRAFTDFMHVYLAGILHAAQNPEFSRRILSFERELYMSDVILAAMQNGMKVETLVFQEGACLDIGSPGDLLKAVRQFNGLESGPPSWD